MDIENKKITIFGGSGFIGRYLVKRLCASGWEIRIAVRDHEAAQFLKPMGDVGQVTIWQTNVLNEEQVLAAVSGVSAVVNLVGILYESGTRTFQEIHCRAVELIAYSAKRMGARDLIHVSALGVDLNSESQYSKTKAEGELCASSAFKNATILRPSVVFGAEDNFFNMFASFSRYLPFLPIYGCTGGLKPTLDNQNSLKFNFYGDGGTKFQPVYVGDVADAILACLSNEKTRGKIFELGGPKVYSFKEIVDLVLTVTNRKRLVIPIPSKVAMFQAFFLQMLPRPLLTCDQVKLLKIDNIVQKGSLEFKDLGIEPLFPELIVPNYLRLYSR